MPEGRAAAASPVPAAAAAVDLVAICRPMTPDERLSAVGRLLACLAPQELGRLRERHFTPAALRRHAAEARDARYRALAAHYPVGPGRVLASKMASDISRYAATAWRYERHGPAPVDPRRAAMWELLQISGGEVLASGSIRRALAGLFSGSKKGTILSHTP